MHPHLSFARRRALAWFTTALAVVILVLAVSSSPASAAEDGGKPSPPKAAAKAGNAPPGKAPETDDAAADDVTPSGLLGFIVAQLMVDVDTDEPTPVPEQPACPEIGSIKDIPVLVGDIFECRAREAGYPKQEAHRIAAEAVVVSHCESKWDPAIVVFNGRYLDAPHPRTGYRYSAAGVFQFIRKTADTWIWGGYDQVRNPRLNIDAAARLYLHNRAEGLGGWEDWACAAANDGFKVGSVLPGWPGGPERMPDWAMEYVAR